MSVDKRKEQLEREFKRRDEQLRRKQLESSVEVINSLKKVARDYEDLARQNGIELSIRFLEDGRIRIYRILNGKRVPIKRTELLLLPIDKKSTVITQLMLSSYHLMVRTKEFAEEG